MREGDDVQDIYWRKSTIPGQTVLRERARDARRRVEIVFDNRQPESLTENWTASYELRVREAASRGVAYLRRGDAVTLRTTSGDTLAVEHAAGADPLLRFLALIEPLPQSSLPPVPAAPPLLSRIPALGDVT